MNGTGKEARIVYSANAFRMVQDCLSGDPSRYMQCIQSNITGSVSGVLLPIIFFIGVLGNIVIAHVMLKRQRPLTRQNLYLGCNAIADILSLVVIGVFNGFLVKGLPWLTRGQFGFFSYNLSDAMCKVSRYALNFCHVLSCMWMLVLVTDRVLVVHRPLAMKKVGLRWAARALAGTLVLSAAIALPNGFLTGHHLLYRPDGVTVILCSHLPDYQLFMMVYTSAMSNPPLLIILLILALDCFLLTRVAAAVRKRRSMSSFGAGGGESQKQKYPKEISGTIIVVILAVIYLALHAPLLACRMLLEISQFVLDTATHLDYIILLADLFFMTLVFSVVSQSLTFFVLMRRSQSFKRCVLAMFCCSAGKDLQSRSDTDQPTASRTAN